MCERISSISDLLAKKELMDDGRWFRGQADVNWNLEPSLFRNQRFVEKKTEILKRFKRDASLVVPQRPSTELEWEVLAQHHGLPTRLLDWTFNPLQALYFAVENQKSSCDAVLYVLDAGLLNKEAIGSNAPDYVFLNSEDNSFSSYEAKIKDPDNRNKVPPMAVISEKTFSRIGAQDGVFLFYGAGEYDVRTIEDVCLSFVIPADKKADIKGELNFLGINEASTYPDLSHIANRIRQEYESR